jgi:hypothetical protein
MDISIAGLRLPLSLRGLWNWEATAKARVHNYTRQIEGCHYWLSPAEEGNQVYMTGQGDRVRCQDYIVLEEAMQYRVEGIERYGDDPNLWTALLVKC